MTSKPRAAGAGEGRDEYERVSATRVPRWIKVAGLIAAVALVLIAVLLLILPGGDDDGPGHGPGRHGSATVHTVES